MAYKVSFKVNDSELMSKLTGKKVILGISVGQEYHESDKLLATIHLINKLPIKECVIAVCDSLQKYNIMDCKDFGSSHSQSLIFGDMWIKRNEHIIKMLTKPNQIIRWDHWLKHKQYPKCKSNIENEYQANHLYKQAVDETIYKFIKRSSAKNQKLIQPILYSRCLEYLLEECAIVMNLWAEDGYDYIIYPQFMTSAMDKTREIFVANTHSNKAQWLPLRFKKIQLEERL